MVIIGNSKKPAEALFKIGGVLDPYDIGQIHYDRIITELLAETQLPIDVAVGDMRLVLPPFDGIDAGARHVVPSDDPWLALVPGPGFFSGPHALCRVSIYRLSEPANCWKRYDFRPVTVT
jgi:hypothetical protein